MSYGVFPGPGSELAETYFQHGIEVKIWTRRGQFCMEISDFRTYGHTFDTIEEARNEANQLIECRKGLWKD